jgi:cell wall-associated NlpC family hydrolase
MFQASRGSAPLLRAALLCSSLLVLPAPATAQIYLKRVLGVESPSNTVEDSVVMLAREQIGRRYSWGGERPETGFDCSGLMRHVLRAMGVNLPRTSAEQARAGQEIPRDILQLRPGDILTFGRGARVTHVGIYSGDGRYIHASSASGRVIEDRIPRTWLLGSTWWKGARRVIASQERPKTEG